MKQLRRADRIQRPHSAKRQPEPDNYESPSEVASGIKLIEAITDDGIRRVVRESLDQIRRTSPDDPDIEALVEDADTHTTTLVNILRERRRNIGQIIESKFQ